MALLEWKDAYRIGIASVDHEHRGLIEMLNRHYEELGSNPGKQAILDFLGEVHSRIAAHFALEERHMRESGYDEYDQHKNEHEQLLDEISDIIDAVHRDEYAGFDDKLASRLRDWFGVHFRTRDARLHRMLG